MDDAQNMDRDKNEQGDLWRVESWMKDWRVSRRRINEWIHGWMNNGWTDKCMEQKDETMSGCIDRQLRAIWRIDGQKVNEYLMNGWMDNEQKDE